MLGGYFTPLEQIFSCLHIKVATEFSFPVATKLLLLPHLWVALFLENLTYLALEQPSIAQETMEQTLFCAQEAYCPGLIAREGRVIIPLLLEAEKKDSLMSFSKKVLSIVRPNLGDNTHGLNISKIDLQILELLCTGASNQEIANQLYLGLSTVKNHIHGIFRLLGAENRSQVILKCQELGIRGKARKTTP